MPISLVEPLPAGTAIRLFLEPDARADRWRLLRRLDASFAGAQDPNAAVVCDSTQQRVVTDANFLTNGTPYFYRLYSRVHGAWVPDGDASATPAYAAADASVDVLSVVRDRLDDGLNAMIVADTLPNPHGAIQVLTAPPAFDETRWPVVTVHLGSDASGERALGEQLEPDAAADAAGRVTLGEGWLANVSLTVVAWSLNADERELLRRAVRAVVLANLPVFDALGVQHVDLSQSDVEDFQSFDAPVYQCVSTLSCVAPAVSASSLPAVTSVPITMTATPRSVRSPRRSTRHVYL